MSTEARERVLQAAARIYRESGLAGLTTEAMAREAGVSKRTIYEQFQGRDEVVEALLVGRMERLEAELWGIVRGEGPVAARLRRFAAVTALLPADFPPMFWQELQRSAPVVAARLRARRERLANGALQAMLQRGVEAGEIRGDLPVPLLAAAAEALAEGLLRQEPPRGSSRLELIEAGISVLLEGVMGRKER